MKILVTSRVLGIREINTYKGKEQMHEDTKSSSSTCNMGCFLSRSTIPLEVRKLKDTTTAAYVNLTQIWLNALGLADPNQSGLYGLPKSEILSNL